MQNVEFNTEKKIIVNMSDKDLQ